jgi:hypothetical protein
LFGKKISSLGKVTVDREEKHNQQFIVKLPPYFDIQPKKYSWKKKKILTLKPLQKKIIRPEDYKQCENNLLIQPNTISWPYADSVLQEGILWGNWNAMQISNKWLLSNRLFF